MSTAAEIHADTVERKKREERRLKYLEEAGLAAIRRGRPLGVLFNRHEWVAEVLGDANAMFDAIELERKRRAELKG